MTRNNEDKDDVLRQLYLSFVRKEPIPKQVSSAFIEKYRKGSEGKIRSWNEVFGTPTRFGTGEKLKRQIKQEHIVLDEVRRLKSVNEEEFEAIGRRLGVGAKSKVKELLHDARLWAERLNFLYRHD